MSIHKNNRGTSLIELIIALMITAIVISMIMLLINSASKSFKITNNDVNLQIEAQTIINQLSNLAMEAKSMEPHIDLNSNERFIFQYHADEFYAIIFNDNILYQLKTDNIGEAKESLLYSKEDHFLAEYVSDLDISPENNTVKIELILSLGKDEVNLSKKVKLRNQKIN